MGEGLLDARTWETHHLRVAVYPQPFVLEKPQHRGAADLDAARFQDLEGGLVDVTDLIVRKHGHRRELHGMFLSPQSPLVTPS